MSVFRVQQSIKQMEDQWGSDHHTDHHEQPIDRLPVGKMPPQESDRYHWEYTVEVSLLGWVT